MRPSLLLAPVFSVHRFAEIGNGRYQPALNSRGRPSWKRRIRNRLFATFLLEPWRRAIYSHGAAACRFPMISRTRQRRLDYVTHGLCIYRRAAGEDENHVRSPLYSNPHVFSRMFSPGLYATLPRGFFPFFCDEIPTPENIILRTRRRNFRKSPKLARLATLLV